MSEPLVSILLPHLREPENDKALRIALDCIVANTGMNYELILESVAERRDIYPVVNSMAERANSDWIIFWNSDVFAAPGWLEPMYEARDENTIVAGVLVEPGAIGVHVLNHQRDFGMTPESFRRTEFEQWVAGGGEWRDGRGWYWPSLHNRKAFLSMGGYDSRRIQWPDPVDSEYWDRWEASGRGFTRVQSWCYHLQNFSNPTEQAKRGIGG